MTEWMGFTCPAPGEADERISMAHGAGGQKSAQLFEQVLRPALSNPWLALAEDAAAIALPELAQGYQLAYTTDSYVVDPLFFPGGDIGELAVTGTVNDLAMKGATPRYLTLGLILEEGLPLALLRQVVASIAATAERAQVAVVAGDTKVVERGKVDKLYINTSGIGVIAPDKSCGVDRIHLGDAVIVSGDIGRHGVAVMAQRPGIGFETDIESDCGLLSPVVSALQAAAVDIHAMRDLTRGGLATALIELAQSRGCSIRLRQADIPVDKRVAAACEILGLDPHYVANEGRCVIFVAQQDVAKTLSILQRFAGAEQASCIGRVCAVERASLSADPQGADLPEQVLSESVLPEFTPQGEIRGEVLLEGEFGQQRRLAKLAGDQLPRIC